MKGSKSWWILDQSMIQPLLVDGWVFLSSLKRWFISLISNMNAEVSYRKCLENADAFDVTYGASTKYGNAEYPLVTENNL